MGRARLANLKGKTVPKPHHSQAPAGIQRKLELARQDVRLDGENGILTVPAVGSWNFIRTAYQYGYHVRPDEVPTPATDRLAAFDGDLADRAALRRQLGIELHYEARAVRFAQSLVAWAAAPSAEEEAEQRRLELEANARTTALETRAQTIVDSAEADRRTKALATARKQAEREIGGAE